MATPDTHRPRNLMLGALVTVLYAVTVLSLTIGFGAYITRTGWAASIATSNNGVQSIDRLLFVMQREALLESDLARQTAILTEIDAEIARSRRNVETARQASTLAAQTFDATFGEARLRIEKARKVIEVETGTGSAADKLGGDFRMLERAVAEISTARDRFTSAADSKTFTDAQAAWTYLTGAETERRLKAEALNAALDAESRVHERRGAALAVIEALKRDIAGTREAIEPNDPDRARFGSISNMVTGSLFLSLVSMPTILLTLLVTIAAGALGTVVSFSRTFLFSATDTQRPSETVSVARLFVSLGEGVAAAIAIFLLSGAGMLVLSQGTGPANSVDLSPYTVAFIAFVSGFMATDAFTRIERAGRSFFNPEDKDGRTGRT